MNQPRSRRKNAWALAIVCSTLGLLAGCQTTAQRMLAEGYPPLYARGYQDGCGSGRQAAGALAEFRKDVTTYLGDVRYASGRDDGFRQCQAGAYSDLQRRLSIDSPADRDWKHSKNQAWARKPGHLPKAP